MPAQLAYAKKAGKKNATPLLAQQQGCHSGCQQLLLYNLRFAFSCQAQRRQHLRRHVLRGGALGGIVVQVASPLDPCGALLEAGRGGGVEGCF